MTQPKPYFSLTPSSEQIYTLTESVVIESLAKPNMGCCSRSTVTDVPPQRLFPQQMIEAVTKEPFNVPLWTRAAEEDSRTIDF